jgi:hypothetical protein
MTKKMLIGVFVVALGIAATVLAANADCVRRQRTAVSAAPAVTVGS